MKKITQKELDVLIVLHEKWLNSDPDGKQLDLSYMDLSELNFCGEDLRRADLRGANLECANLRYVDLVRANLENANLEGADMKIANLKHANLFNANLNGANLQDANLQYADLRNTNLEGTNMKGVDLTWIRIEGANMEGTNLENVNLMCVNLSRTNISNICANLYTKGYFMVCPEEGSYVAYKKCRDDKIVKLLIPEDAKRSSATSRKCRASKAKVLSITSIDGRENYNDATSFHDEKFIYKIGETVEVLNFCEDRWDECAPGIHHYITREEAVLY